MEEGGRAGDATNKDEFEGAGTGVFFYANRHG
jgi:hypothetical protein